MDLAEIEKALQTRLDYLQKRHDEGFERPSWNAWLDCYNALARVRQARALEHIEAIMHNGLPVERVP